MNNILFTPSTRKWFSRKGILPDSWEIPVPEQQRIKNAPIAISLFNSPACSMPLSDLLRNRPGVRDVVMLDCVLCETKCLSEVDIVAILLHEIGHTVNLPPCFYEDADDYAVPEGDMEEYYADDYVRHCGFEEVWVNLLKRMRRENVYGFLGDSIERRIQRIEDGEKLRLNLA